MAIIMASADPVQEIGGLDLQRPRELDDRAEPRFAPGAFEQAHLRAVKVTEIAERLLREPGLFALAAKVLREAPR